MNSISEEHYIAELKTIINPQSFMDTADLMPYCLDLIDSIFKKEDFLHYNDNIPKFNLETTKTSLIYKMMFDFSNKSAFIFANGFDKHAFDKTYVIEAFRNFVFRVFDNNEMTGENNIPLTLISKGRFENIDRNLRASDFFKEVLLLQNSTAENNIVYSLSNYDLGSQINKFLTIESIIERDEEVGINIIENTASKNKKDISLMNSFSVFDNLFYRVERDNEAEEGKAYVNFGDVNGAKVLSDFFNILNDSDNNKYKFKRANNERNNT